MKNLYTLGLLLYLCIGILSCTKENCAMEVTIFREPLPLQQFRYAVSITGGAEPFTYVWSTGQTTATIINMAELSSYSVTVTDLSDCEAEFKFNTPADCGLTISDLNGTEYPIVNINNKCWMAHNLNFGVGTIKDSIGWIAIGMQKVPGVTVANNDESTRDDFGLLYNWYAVNQSNICPAGWHIPSIDEWSALITSLGGETVAGAALKSTNPDVWDVTNTLATNTSGFSAVGAGDCSNQGLYESFLNAGIYWTSTAKDDNSAHSVILFSNAISVLKSTQNKAHGYSCRCVRD